MLYVGGRLEMAAARRLDVNETPEMADLAAETPPHEPVQHQQLSTGAAPSPTEKAQLAEHEHPAALGPTVVSDYTALLGGSIWGDGVIGKGFFYTYSFSVSVPAAYYDLYDAEALATFRPLTDAEADTARAALDAWASVSGIEFFEVPAGQGDMQFGAYDLQALSPGSYAAGWAYYPSQPFSNPGWAHDPWTPSSDVFMDTSLSGDLTHLFLHEIGHAIGFQHPHDEDIVLDPSLDSTSNTVMSYSGPWVDTLGPFDLQAVEHYYGDAAADGAHVASSSWNPTDFVLTQIGFETADDIRGVAVRDVIDGAGGDDRIVGAEGDDALSGGLGADVLTGGLGSDELNGGDDNDIMLGGLGNDTLNGGAGADDLRGGAGEDTLSGGAGDDRLTASGPKLVVDGGEGVDVFQVVTVTSKAGVFDFATLLAAGSTFTGVERFDIWGGAYADTITGGGFDDRIAGSGGNDDIKTAGGADSAWGGAGDDRLSGGVGGDYLSGDDGDDVVLGGASADNMWGGAGFDLASFEDAIAGVTVTVNVTRQVDGAWEYLSQFEGLIGSAFDDALTGSTAANLLEGGAGNDRLYGGDGSDMLDGGSGDDQLSGGLGFDTASYMTATAAVSVNLATTVAQATGGAGRDTLSSIENLRGSDAFGDTLLGSSANNTINGYGGNDTIRGGRGHDSLLGWFGDDLLDGGAGNDRLNGGSGIDTATYYYAAGPVTVSLGLTGAQVTGGAGTDTLVAIENLNGSLYADVLTGWTGANVINGYGGNDRIRGGDGADTLTGGTGADTFIFALMTDSDALERDRITDFSGEDILDLSGLDANGSGSGNGAFSRIGDAAAFTAAGQLRLSLHGADTWVELNTDADADAEAVIILAGNHMAATADDGWIL